MISDIDRVVARLRSKLADLNTQPPDPAYDYSSLGLCIIDAVFSIGAHYRSTERVVQTFCERFDWIRDGRGTVEERTVSDLLGVSTGIQESLARDGASRLRKQSENFVQIRYSQAEAAFRFAKIVQQFGIETFADE